MMPGLYRPRKKAVCEGAHTSFVRIRKHMSRLKISAISYLNTAPLLWDFEHGEAGADFHIFYTIPPPRPEAVRAGAADIRINPAPAFAAIPQFVHLSYVTIP